MERKRLDNSLMLFRVIDLIRECWYRQGTGDGIDQLLHLILLAQHWSHNTPIAPKLDIVRHWLLQKASAELVLQQRRDDSSLHAMAMKFAEVSSELYDAMNALLSLGDDWDSLQTPEQTRIEHEEDAAVVASLATCRRCGQPSGSKGGLCDEHEEALAKSLDLAAQGAHVRTAREEEMALVAGYLNKRALEIQGDGQDSRGTSLLRMIAKEIACHDHRTTSSLAAMHARRKESKDVLCNLCGHTCVVGHPESFARGPSGLVEAEVFGGYESSPSVFGGTLDDGARYRFSVCEWCLDALFLCFVIPVEVDNYMTSSPSSLFQGDDPEPPWKPAILRIMDRSEGDGDTPRIMDNFVRNVEKRVATRNVTIEPLGSPSWMKTHR